MKALPRSANLLLGICGGIPIPASADSFSGSVAAAEAVLAPASDGNDCGVATPASMSGVAAVCGWGRERAGGSSTSIAARGGRRITSDATGASEADHRRFGKRQEEGCHS